MMSTDMGISVHGVTAIETRAVCIMRSPMNAFRSLLPLWVLLASCCIAIATYRLAWVLL